jgi:serine/threonine protein kinase
MSLLICPRCQTPVPEDAPAPQTCSRCGQLLAGTLTAGTADQDPDATRHYSPSPSETDVPEQVGPYRLLRRLGSGGMGTVYEAEAGDRRVAVKLITPGRALSADAVERFRREGRLAGSITDPRCVFVSPPTPMPAGRTSSWS